MSIQTERLILRAWQDRDVEALIAMNQDPRVMEFFPSLLSPEQTLAFVGRINEHFEEHGFSLWAVELKETGEMIGFVGLMVPSFEAHFTPCVEVGWRLDPKHWGKGYAVEAAKKVLQLGFEEHGLKEIVSFTTAINTRSIRVMQKLGMTHHPEDDFIHPKLPEDHPLAPHVLYRIKP